MTKQTPRTTEERTPRDRAIDLIYDSMERRGFGSPQSRAHAVELVEEVEAAAATLSLPDEWLLSISMMEAARRIDMEIPVGHSWRELAMLTNVILADQYRAASSGPSKGEPTCHVHRHPYGPQYHDECDITDRAASPAGPEAVPQSELPQPRDTPHLDRDGDRWRGRSSEARLAVTDDGPRSESRSSGGWQGGPSGDIQRAIAIIEDSRQTHVNWADWRRKGNGTDTDHEMIGDLEWHENAIRDYDHVLAVLRSGAVPQSEPPDGRCTAASARCEKPAGHEGGHYTEYREPVWSYRVGAVPQSEREGLGVERLGLSAEQTRNLRQHLIARRQTLGEWVSDVLFDFRMGRPDGIEYPPALASPAHPDEGPR
jgi:hypothetical protein